MNVYSWLGSVGCSVNMCFVLQSEISQQILQTFVVSPSLGLDPHIKNIPL